MSLPPQHRATQKRALEERRRRVTALWIMGVHDQTTIAERLDVSQQTISRDLAVIEREWRERSAEMVDVAKGLQHARLEELIRALWPEGRKGTWLVVDRLIALLEREAKLLGLDAPSRQQVSGDDGGPFEFTIRIPGRISDERDRDRDLTGAS